MEKLVMGKGSVEINIDRVIFIGLIINLFVQHLYFLTLQHFMII